MKKLLTIAILIVACAALCAPVWPQSGMGLNESATANPPTESQTVATANEALSVKSGVQTDTASLTPEITTEEEGSPVSEPPSADCIMDTIPADPVAQQGPSAQEAVAQSVSESNPGAIKSDGDKKYTWVPGFGWVEGGGENTVIYAEDMYENGNKIGSMGGDLEPAPTVAHIDQSEPTGEVIDQTINAVPEKSSTPPDYHPETVPPTEG